VPGKSLSDFIIDISAAILKGVAVSQGADPTLATLVEKTAAYSGQQLVDLLRQDSSPLSSQLLKARSVSQECFESRCQEQGLRAALADLSPLSAQVVQDALLDLRSHWDESRLQAAILAAIQRDLSVLTSDQQLEVTNIYLDCIRRALQNIPVLGPKIHAFATFRIDARTARIEEMVVEILASIRSIDRSGASDSIYIPEPLHQRNTLPNPGILPPGSRMLFVRNAVFTGRKKDLRAIARALFFSSQKKHTIINQSTTVATGLGGIGKSQLAIEFCYRFGRFTHGVHWINAANPANIESEIAACGFAMKLQPWPDEITEQFKITLRAWQHNPDRIVILDNLEKPEDLRHWLPCLGFVKLLVTSRCSQWPVNLDLFALSLDTLSPSESLSLLCLLAPHLKNEPEIDLINLAEFLGYLPLALDLAGRYLSDRTSVSVFQYLIDLRFSGIQHPSLLDWSQDTSTESPPNLIETFMLSLNQLSNSIDDLIAKKLFLLCGYCAPNIPIPSFIYSSFLQDNEHLDSLQVDRSLRRLYKIGLLKPQPGGPTVHPWLSRFARFLDSDSSDEFLHSLVKFYIELAGKDIQSSKLDRFQLYNMHLQSIALAAEEKKLINAGLLFIVLGSLQQDIGDYQSARWSLEKAVLLDTQRLDSDDPDLAVSINNLGMVLYKLGDYPAAQERLERALQIMERAIPPDHPDMGLLLNNLGMVLSKLGDYPAAQEYLERGLQIMEKTLGPDHPDLGMPLSNLGGVLSQLGNHPAAKELLERALHIMEKTLPPDPHSAPDSSQSGEYRVSLGDELRDKI
jgi:tetratricopeptide (TPR) repeat protein